MTLIDKAEALAPCPFCGGEATFSEGKTGDGKPWHYVECTDCEAMGPGVSYADHNIAVKSALADAWNRRATLPARGVGEQAAYVRGLEAALDMIRSMRASEGVVIGRDLICTALEMAVTKNRAALHVNETPEIEHDAGNMLTAAQAPAEDAHVKGETAGQMLERLGMDGVKWAAEFRTTALRLGYSDMDEGWLIGWFCNAIMAGYDRSAAQAREAALHPDDMLPEAIRLIRQEASRDHSQDVVTGLKHIALLLEQLIGEART